LLGSCIYNKHLQAILNTNSVVMMDVG